MRKRLWPRASAFGCLALLIMAAPQVAKAYVDPGSGAMLWQIAAAAVIGSLFYVRRLVVWVRDHLGLRSTWATGFLFASCFALLASALTLKVFESHPLPRFNDIYLVGIVLTCYLFNWKPAAFLLAISLLVSAWVLPPDGSFGVEGFAGWYRLVSFGMLSVFLIWLIARLQTRTAIAALEEHRESLVLEGVGAGVD